MEIVINVIGQKKLKELKHLDNFSSTGLKHTFLILGHNTDKTKIKVLRAKGLKQFLLSNNSNVIHVELNVLD